MIIESDRAPIPEPSPSWSPTVKLVVGLSVAAIILALLIFFRQIIGPLLLAIILAYALHPLVAYVNRTVHLTWRWSVNIVFILFVIIVLAILTIAGFAIVSQVQSLIAILISFTGNLPEIVNRLSQQIIVIGPFRFSLAQYDLTFIVNQILSILQPVLGQVGTIVSSFATSALVTIGWIFFIIVIAYFLLSQTKKVGDQLINLEIPGYNEDVQRLTFELRNIWNVFLRGQLIIFFLTIIIYSILLTTLGLHFALGIAILAGLARFIPYVGPFIVWTITFLISFFQSDNYFGLQPLWYALIIVGACIIVDQIMDNFVLPRFHGKTLGLHPAAVLIAALGAAKAIGFIGLILAAPVLASLILLSRYIARKMLDLDPWPEGDYEQKQLEFPWVVLVNRTRQWLRRKKTN
jgi:predicted PurR-regulated permease PerM